MLQLGKWSLCPKLKIVRKRKVRRFITALSGVPARHLRIAIWGAAVAQMMQGRQVKLVIAYICDKKL